MDATPPAITKWRSAAVSIPVPMMTPVPGKAVAAGTVVMVGTAAAGTTQGSCLRILHLMIHARMLATIPLLEIHSDIPDALRLKMHSDFT